MSEPRMVSPAGLETAVNFVRRVAKEAQFYRFSGMKPEHCILNLDPGEGRSTFVRFMTDVYMKCNVRRFESMEPYLEYDLTGDAFQLQAMFYDIQSNAAYTNHYSGIIALSLSSGFADTMAAEESGIEIFFRKIKEVAKNATLVFFVPKVLEPNMQELEERLCDTLGQGNVEVIRTEDYTASDLAEILRRQLVQSQVVLDGSPCLQALLLDAAVYGAKVRTVKEVEKLCRSLIRQADFREEIPRLNCAELLPALQQKYAANHQEVSYGN